MEGIVSQISVVIVDDHPFFRQGVRDALETDAGLQVVGEASNGETVSQLAEDLHPNIVLLDINLPDVNGLQVTRQIRARQPGTRIIVITGYDDAEQAFHAIRAGASAYCVKDIAPESLISMIYAVHDGYYVVGDRRMSYDETVKWVEEKVGRLAGHLATDIEDSFVPLSPREMEILAYVTHGRSNKEIAYALGISHQTVKNHMTAILRKLSVDDRTQAAVYALSRGWVRLDRPL
ncbi:MAG: response regulator [Candidatus Promineifilaceae bacterium]